MITTEENIQQIINKDKQFKEFVNKALTHFIRFVVPRRDQTEKIEELYRIPDRFENLPSASIEINREPKTNYILIKFVP